jgi:hypothetical protein
MTVPKISDDCHERGFCWACEDRGLQGVTHGLRDARGDHATVEGAYLPHSCDKWVIGGAREIDALIEDLRAAKAMLEERKACQ